MRNAMIALATLLVGVSLGLPSFAAAWATPGAACTQEGANANSDGFLTCTGGVWVSNAVLLGTTSATCDSTKAGYIRYAGGKFEGCNGTGWIRLAGGMPTSYAGATPTTYNGNAGGPAGLNSKCAAAFPGSRAMRFSEIIWFASSMSTYGWVFDDAGVFSDEGVGSTFSNGGCRGFTSSSGSYYGANSDGSGGVGKDICSTARKIHCVID